ncbi:MAG: hypothetical protein CSB55_03785 [Candidatus Cloacimonadota bacterium]|nr:MAG: hypothetical protein CSB55_03785 [Candidatus Cloacimonadota bacterium]
MKKNVLLLFSLLLIIGCKSGRSVVFGPFFKYKLSSFERSVGLTESYHDLYEKTCAFENRNVILNKMILSDVASYIFIAVPFEVKPEDLEDDLQNSKGYGFIDKKEISVSGKKENLYLVKKNGDFQLKLVIKNEKGAAVISYFDSDPEKINKLFNNDQYFAERIK